MQAADKAKSIAWLGAVVLTMASCVYFNALYNANRLFDRGRDEMEAGNISSGASLLGQSIEKAERIVAHHPDSRWADDAWRLIVRSHLLREEWPEAAQAGRQLLARMTSKDDTIEVAGYLGVAEAEIGNAAAADSLLTTALSVRLDNDRRARLLFYRGRARVALDRVEEADADLREASDLRPDWVEPRLERTALLVSLGDLEEAAAQFRHVAGRRQPFEVESNIVQAAQDAGAADPEAGLALLADIERSELRRERRADLQVYRAELALAVHDTAAAEADFRAVIGGGTESQRAVDAYLAMVEIGLRRAARPDDLNEIRTLLVRATSARMSRNLARIRGLTTTLRKVEYWIGRGGIGYIAAAETARDRLGAPRLARNLFLEYVRTEPEALWAPKAILAALALSPVDSEGMSAMQSDSELRQRLVEDYRDSAYVEVLLGGDESIYTYEELETGLAQQLERLQFQADQELGGTPRTGAAR